MQSLNHLIWGYIRTSRGAFIPNDIKLLIEQYMQYREYEGIFELQNTGKSCKVITPKELTTSSNQSARLSLALPRYKQYPFIKTWKVKFIARRDAKYKREFDHTAYDGLIDAFGVSGWPKMVFNGNGTHQRDESMTASCVFMMLWKLNMIQRNASCHSQTLQSITRFGKYNYLKTIHGFLLYRLMPLVYAVKSFDNLHPQNAGFV
eukprot:351359_1